ncbi:carotenoid cleavage dioxygenase [Tanacetum coccineum]
MNLMGMILGGSPVSADPRKVARLAVIPRHAKDDSEMKWFEVPGLNVVHCINTWEEDHGDTVGPLMKEKKKPRAALIDRNHQQQQRAVVFSFCFSVSTSTRKKKGCVDNHQKSKERKKERFSY